MHIHTLSPFWLKSSITRSFRRLGWFCCEPLCSRHTQFFQGCLKADPGWHFVVFHSNSISGAVSGGNTHLSVLTLVKFELVAMMVLALFFAATNLECGLAPLEHDLLRGLAHVGLGPRQCAATPILPYVASVGVEMVSGTPGAGVLCQRGCYGARGRDLGYPLGV